MLITATLTRLEHTYTDHRVPTEWTRQVADLDRYRTIGEIIAAIRAYRQITESDQTLRALLTINDRHEPDPRTIVLIALAPMTLHWRGAPPADPNELISELGAVICDPGTIDHGTRLYGRLIARAMKRSERRRSDRHLDPNRSVIIDHRDLDQQADRDSGNFANDVIDRVALGGFRAAVESAISSGDIPAAAWAVFLDGALAQSLELHSGHRHNLRNARRHLAPIIQRTLAA